MDQMIMLIKHSNTTYTLAHVSFYNTSCIYSYSLFIVYNKRMVVIVTVVVYHRMGCLPVEHFELLNRMG